MRSCSVSSSQVIRKSYQMADQYSNYGSGGMMPNNFGGQANFSVPPPSFGGAQQFKNDNQGNWQPPSTGGGGGGENEMITQEDTIFIAGMNAHSTEEDIANHFGAIGIIKKDKKTMKPKIWLYRNKETGESKGEATVTYDDSNAAKSAISWFDGRDFNGSTVRVSLA
ncbi:RNA-binding protein cabeza, partial [Pseudolycoriella hygida]